MPTKAQAKNTTKKSPAQTKPQAVAHEESTGTVASVAPSFVNTLTTLEPGDCASRVRPLILGDSISNQFADYPDRRQQFRNAITPSTVQAQRKLAAQGVVASFSIEISETITPAGRVYLVAIVTRTL